MAPNTIEMLPQDEPVDVSLPVEPPIRSVKENYGWHISQAALNMVGRVCVGIVVGICIAFAFRNEEPYDIINVHIILCVIGCQLFMAEGCLALAPASWTSHFTLVDKKRVHWILLLLGSILAIVGSIIQYFVNIKIYNRNFFTYHGQFALVAMVFSAASLINGLTSLYGNKLRRFLPGKLSKLSHICFGAVAFLTSCVSLVYAMKYTYFVTWMPDFNKAIIGITCILTIIVTVNPLLSFFQMSRSVFRNKFSK